MDNSFNDRKIVIACSIGIIVVLIISVTSIVSIWKKNLGTESNAQNEIAENADLYADTEIGTFEVVNASKDTQIKKYSMNVAETLEFGNIDAIYEMLDPGYIKYFNITKESLETKLKGKSILGNKISMTGYTSASLNDMVVYSTDYSNSDNSINCNINIIEKSPNNYTIAFDDFVAYIEEPKEFVQDGLKFTIYDQAWFKTKYKLKAKLQNFNEESYIVNSSRLYENCYIKLSSSSELRTISTVLAGESVNLDKNGEMNYVLEFNISELGFSTVKSFILKDIKSVSTGISKDYEFEI